MSDVALYEQAIGAAELLLRNVYRLNVTKGLDPLDPRQFLVIIERLTQRLYGATRSTEQAALKAALRELDVDWPALSAAGRDRAVAASKIALDAARRGALPHVRATFEAQASRIVNDTRQAARRRFAFDIDATLSRTDERIAEHLRKSQTAFVTDAYGRRVEAFGEQARQTIARGLEQGLDRTAIAQDLARMTGAAALNRGESYWRLVSAAFANRARVGTQVAAFAEARVDRFKFIAVMDERTCFAAGTRVRLAGGGSRRIENLRPGDAVLSCRGQARRVLAQRVHAKRQWCEVHLSDGRKLRVTPNHPLLTTHGWVHAGSIHAGDELVRGVLQGLGDVRSLWTHDAPEARWASTDQVLLAGMSRTRRESAAPMRDMWAMVSANGGMAVSLFAGMQDDASHLRNLQAGVHTPARARAPRKRDLLLSGVLASGSARRDHGRRDNERLRDLREDVRLSAECGASRSHETALLKRVSTTGDQGDVSDLWEDVRTEGDRGISAALLLTPMLSEIESGDEHRADSTEATRVASHQLRTADADRSLDCRLPRWRSARGRSRRRVLASQNVRARCAAGRGTGRARLHDASTRGERTPTRSAVCDPRSLELWPVAVDDLADRAATIRVALITHHLTKTAEPAYDVEVERDHGYIAEGIVVHNSEVCRFLDGTIWSVPRALGTLERAMKAEDPEEIRAIQPWVQSGKDESGQPIIYYTKPDGSRQIVADVLRSGVGQRDVAGEFRARMDPREIESGGIQMPPLHELCRSTISTLV